MVKGAGWGGQSWRNVADILEPASQRGQIIFGDYDPFEHLQGIGRDLIGRLAGDLKEVGVGADRCDRMEWLPGLG